MDLRTEGTVQQTDQMSFIAKIKKSISQNSRRKRAQIFERIFMNSDNLAIIDLGGGKGTYFARYLTSKKNVTIADYNVSDLIFAEKNYKFKTVAVNGTEGLQFVDGQFDIVFSNSVIEHVTGPKDEAIDLFKVDGDRFRSTAFEFQKKFADDVRRIGNGYFVQTPNRYFIVEQHSWIPLINLLPTHIQWRVIKRFNHFWPRKVEGTDWSLLSVADMRRLFPDAEIHRERWLGIFTKSIIAVKPFIRAQKDS